MKKFTVYQSFSGTIVREIEAETPEGAEKRMLSEEIGITLEEMLDCEWERPEAQGG